ncbi:MAG: hypothetical protein KZQ99_08690 [Candidatus Thiodiazotropha sp. (ex Dulcina madagascariensis)]|nr:hypothetical protein [Candidatus Thiodiazotropha sp. (ex Dulcina madagascariensis)]
MGSLCYASFTPHGLAVKPRMVKFSEGTELLRILLLLAMIGLALHLWKGFEASKSVALPNSPNGFVSVLMPSGAKSNTVLILAPKNCPSDAAQRAVALAARLTELGIPNQRSSNVTLMVTNPTEEQKAAMERSDEILKGEIPAVFINGVGKANPTVKEVVAEYRRTQ